MTMRILFISRYKWPHVGGVERHVDKISKTDNFKDYDIKVVSLEDINSPKVRVIGLLYIWYWFVLNSNLIRRSDIIHIHDVFIWYLPFVFIYRHKPVYITFHGWEGRYPIPFWSILNKKIAYYLTNGSISIGKYIGKYYGIKSNYIVYGGVDSLNLINKKINKNLGTIVYLGRLNEDTGLIIFLEYLKSNKKRFTKIIFVGDGNLKNKCKKYGKVTGNVYDSDKYLRSAEYCVPSGYLSYLEAVNNQCKVITFASNKLKSDYWNEIKKYKKIDSWSSVAKIYKKLWNI